MTPGAATDRAGLLAEAVRLSHRLDELESLTEIENLHRRFVRAVADRNFDGLAAYFTDDAVIDMRTHGPKAGRAAIAEHFSHMRSVPLDGAGYLLTSPVVRVSGNEGEGTWMWLRLHSRGQVAGRTVRIGGVWEDGRYHCRYRRDVGTWRFTAMRFRVVRPDPDVTTDEGQEPGT